MIIRHYSTYQYIFDFITPLKVCINDQSSLDIKLLKTRTI